MKKAIAILLCLMLALGCAAAMAETGEKESIGTISVNGAFDLRGVIPDGYTLVVLEEEPGYFCAMLMADDSLPTMTISIAHHELLSDVERLNDLDEDMLSLIESTFQDEDGVDISYMDTTYGTRLMVVKEVEDGIDYVDFYTIYKGYEIEFVLTQSQANLGKPISDAQIETAVQFLSDLEFVPVAAE